ncbi:uncharacterized protein METZ01_LOCUS299962, partial [marine metagenome]
PHIDAARGALALRLATRARQRRSQALHRFPAPARLGIRSDI